MKFMILVKSNPSLEKSIDAMSDAAMQASMGRDGHLQPRRSGKPA